MLRPCALHGNLKFRRGSVPDLANDIDVTAAVVVVIYCNLLKTLHTHDEFFSCYSSARISSMFVELSHPSVRTIVSPNWKEVLVSVSVCVKSLPISIWISHRPQTHTYTHAHTRSAVAFLDFDSTVCTWKNGNYAYGISEISFSRIYFI